MKIPKAWSCSLLSMFFLTAGLQAQSRESLLKTITQSPGWNAAGETRQYNDSNIETLSGKVATSLRRYGMVGVSVQDLKGEQGRVRLSLFEMVDPSAAYGFFTLERDAEREGASSLPVGTEGFHTSTKTYFWQSKYVVKLEGEPGASATLAHLVSENVFGRSKKPPVSDHLPPNNLVPDSEKYIVEATGMDPALGLDSSTLGFEDSVEIATARYRVNGKDATLVLLLYPTQHLAKKYFESMNAALTQDPFGKRTVAMISFVRGTHDANVAKEILNAIGYETKTTWNERRPDITIRQVILTAFTFIGIALVFMIVAGMSFGGFRIFVQSKYPNWFFNRQSAEEIIQLKLIQEVTDKQIEK